MTATILTPFDFSEPVKAGRRRFWKQILPVTEIDYKGRRIKFDEKYHRDLELSFRQGAYDQVPIVFADGNNAHNMDPRNFGGEVLDVQNRGAKGTWALIEADREAARAIKRNPKLGVSARIVEGLQRDGKEFGRAINHVLLTMNPRVTGMAPWQAVDLSEVADEEVVDLSTRTYTEGTDMVTKTAKTKATAKPLDLSGLDDEQFAALVDLATTVGVLDKEDADEDEDETVEDEVVEVPPKKKKSKTTVTVTEDSEESGPEDEDDEDEDDETNLSEPTHKVKVRKGGGLRALQIDLAEQRWNNERRELTDAGVPPFMLDLAAPILGSPDEMVIDLAEGDSINPAEVIRKILKGVEGVVDLSDDLGHGVDLSVENDSDKAFLAAWDEQYG